MPMTGVTGTSRVDPDLATGTCIRIGDVIAGSGMASPHADLGRILSLIPATALPSRGECVRTARALAMLACGDDESLSEIDDAARTLADALSASSARLLAMVTCLVRVLEDSHAAAPAGRRTGYSAVRGNGHTGECPSGAAGRIVSGDYGLDGAPSADRRDAAEVPEGSSHPAPATREEMRRYGAVASLSMSLLDALGTYPDTPEARVIVRELGRADPMVLAAVREGCRRIEDETDASAWEHEDAGIRAVP